MQMYPDWSSRTNATRGKKRKRKQEPTDGGTKMKLKIFFYFFFSLLSQIFIFLIPTFFVIFVHKKIAFCQWKMKKKLWENFYCDRNFLRQSVFFLLINWRNFWENSSLKLRKYEICGHKKIYLKICCFWGCFLILILELNFYWDLKCLLNWVCGDSWAELTELAELSEFSIAE